MLKVKITKPATTHTSAAGKPYMKQRGQVHLFDRDGVLEELPRAIEFITDVNHPAGDYVLSPASFKVGAYDKLELSRMVFAPVPAAK